MEVFAGFLKELTSMQRAQARGKEAPPGDMMPYKPILVLAVLSLIRTGRVTENRFAAEPLKAEYDRLFKAAFRRPGQTAKAVPASSFVQPFWYMKSSSFWQHVAVAGREASLAVLIESGAELKSLSALDRNVAHVSLHPAELFPLLRERALADIAAEMLLSTYFDAPYDEDLRRAMDEDAGAGTGHPFWNRAAARRETDVVRAYGGRCVVCKLAAHGEIRCLPVDAAHVRPRSWGGLGDSENLILLCKLHHWAFDSGVMTIDRTLTVHVSAMCSDGDAFERELASYEGERLELPATAGRGPAPEGLEWHGRNLFAGPCRRGCVR